jgi:hypothetical protein
MPAASKSDADLEILQGHADRDRVIIVDLAARSMEAAEVEKIAGTWARDKAAETLRSRMRATPDAVGVPKAHAIRTR